MKHVIIGKHALFNNICMETQLYDNKNIYLKANKTYLII